MKGEISPVASKALRDEVFTIMKHDHIGDVARLKRNPLIILTGQRVDVKKHW